MTTTKRHRTGVNRTGWRHIRKSLPMSVGNWIAVTATAADLGATFAGKPSWRVLLRWIAEGKVRCKLASRGVAK